MSKKHVVLLTEEEIRTLSTLCWSCQKMTESAFFQKLENDAKTAGDKLAAKLKEIDAKENGQ